MKSLMSRLFAVVGLAIFFAAPTQAQATRTWVSGVGDDANPCSRTAPCKTFAGAISKTAAGGEINCLDSGGFGALTITKAIMIDCTGSIAGVLASGTNGIVVNAGVNDVVVLNGLLIDGVGTGLQGIRFIAGKGLHVMNTVIRRFAQKGIDFQPTASATLIVQDSVIVENDNAVSGGGIFIKPVAGATANASLSNVHLDRNRFGLRAEDRSTVSLARCTTSNNVTNGVLAFSAAEVTQVSVDSSTSNGNLVNGILVTGANARLFLSRSVVTGNATGLGTPSGTIFGTDPGTNVVTGNGVDGAPNGTAVLRFPMPSWW